jgi:hypothetical protein
MASSLPTEPSIAGEDKRIHICTCNCWSEFYKYVKKRKRNKEIISAISDHNGMINMDDNEKANNLNSYYASIFPAIVKPQK